MATGLKDTRISIMISIVITKDSEVAKLRALGVVERKEESEWAADKKQMPFSQRDYGHTYKTIIRGSKKRS